MKITQITVCFGGTVNLGNYNNARLEASITASLAPDDDEEAVLADLWRRVKETVRAEARELKGKPGAEADPRFAEGQPAAPDPKSKNLGDMVTPKQLWMLRSLAREGGFDAEADCQEALNCSLEEMSKKAASGLIDRFQRIANERAA